MSKPMKANRTAGAAGSGRSRIRWRAASLAAAAATALLAGCANRDSVTVGSIPDDYRTNHPIVLAEKELSIDLPVASSDRGMTQSQKIQLEGLLHRYDRTSAPVVQVLVPSGSANDVAAAHASSGFVTVLKANGVPGGRIAVSHYQADAAETAAPIRVSFLAMQAQTGKCGRWPEDILQNAENKHYANFGCSYQNNLAAQIANPADLLGPRKPSSIDAAKRGVAIDEWQNTPGDWTQEVEY